MKVSLITFSKGRRHHLEQTLPGMLRQVVPSCWRYQVVVVDYGCPDRTADWCEQWAATQSSLVDKLTIVRAYPVGDELNRSHARNIGAVAADAYAQNLLAFVDADAVLGPDWLMTTIQPIEDEDQVVIVTPNWNSKTDQKEKGVGCCAVTAQAYWNSRGYDESLEGWGYEDEDFWRRCQKFGPAAKAGGERIRMLRHRLRDRVAHHQVRDILRSKLANIERVKQRIGLVNPNGWGQGNVWVSHVATHC